MRLRTRWLVAAVGALTLAGLHVIRWRRQDRRRLVPGAPADHARPARHCGARRSVRFAARADIRIQLLPLEPAAKGRARERASRRRLCAPAGSRGNPRPRRVRLGLGCPSSRRSHLHRQRRHPCRAATAVGDRRRLEALGLAHPGRRRQDAPLDVAAQHGHTNRVCSTTSRHLPSRRAAWTWSPSAPTSRLTSVTTRWFPSR